MSSLDKSPHCCHNLLINEWGFLECLESASGNASKLHESRLMVIISTSRGIPQRCYIFLSPLNSSSSGGGGGNSTSTSSSSSSNSNNSSSRDIAIQYSIYHYHHHQHHYYYYYNYIYIIHCCQLLGSISRKNP